MRTTAELDQLIHDEFIRFNALKGDHDKLMTALYAERFEALHFEQDGQPGLGLLREFPPRTPLLTIPEFWDADVMDIPHWWPEWGTLFTVYIESPDYKQGVIYVGESAQQKTVAKVPVELARKMRQAWLDANPAIGEEQS